MFPLKDDNPTHGPSIVTWTIVGVNVLAWVLVQGAGSGLAVATSVCNYGLIPGELMLRVTPGAGFPMGPELACLMDEGRAPHHLVTSMFLHGGWGHLLGNMWFLYIFGNNIEEAFGHAKFLGFYLLTGLAAAALQVAAEPGSMIPMVGASGAISGVMGAYLLFYPKARVKNLLILGVFITTVNLPAWGMLGYWMAIQLFGGFLSGAGQGGTAYWAHVGGFVAGLLLALPALARVRGAGRWQAELR
jgi:membrane associated rhomboid family serine protease